MSQVSETPVADASITEAPLIAVAMPADGVALFTLNRPQKRNALSRALLTALAEECRRAAADPQVRCVVLTGGDHFFCAGADIIEMQQHGYAALEHPDRCVAWATITDFPKPLVAAVEGICFGGGHELAMLADIVIASESARFSQPEIRLGILPGDGATQRLTRIAGKSLAMKMMLTGEAIGAHSALLAGLAAEVVLAGGATARAVELATAIAAMPPVATRLVKEAVLAAYEVPLSAGLQVERRAIRYAFTTEDQTEGMTAFAQKRPPQWRGR